MAMNKLGEFLQSLLRIQAETSADINQHEVKA